MEDKIFNLSLVLSFLLHIFTFACLFFANIQYGRHAPLRSTEVVYQTEARQLKGTSSKPKKIMSVREEKLKPNPEILSRKDSSFSPVPKNISKDPIKLKTHSKPQLKIQALQGKRLVAVPMLQSEKITNPRYLNYHDRIRNKIRDRAYFYVDDPRFQEGEVYLTFVISREGSLRQVKIISDKTSANDYLRNIGLRSIKESAPFPAFPADLKYPELTFNVIISFKIDEQPVRQLTH